MGDIWNYVENATRGCRAKKCGKMNTLVVKSALSRWKTQLRVIRVAIDNGVDIDGLF